MKNINDNLKDLIKLIKKGIAFDYLTKYFNIICSTDKLLTGEICCRLISIQSKADEGTYDTTAIADLLHCEEEYDFIKEVLKNERKEND